MISASHRLALSRLVPFRFAPRKSARYNLAPRKSACDKSAPCKLALLRSVPCKVACFKEVFCRLASSINAKVYLGLLHLLGRGFAEEVNFNEAVLGEPTGVCAFAFACYAAQEMREIQMEIGVDNGDFLQPMTLFNHFSKLLKEIGLPHMRFHDLRHSAATLLLSMGGPLKVVQELLGHSNFSMKANIYAHVLPSMQQEAMNKMDDFFRGHS